MMLKSASFGFDAVTGWRSPSQRQARASGRRAAALLLSFALVLSGCQIVQQTQDAVVSGWQAIETVLDGSDHEPSARTSNEPTTTQVPAPLVELPPRTELAIVETKRFPALLTVKVKNLGDRPLDDATVELIRAADSGETLASARLGEPVPPSGEALVSMSITVPDQADQAGVIPLDTLVRLTSPTQGMLTFIPARLEVVSAPPRVRVAYQLQGQDSLELPPNGPADLVVTVTNESGLRLADLTLGVAVTPDVGKATTRPVERRIGELGAGAEARESVPIAAPARVKHVEVTTTIHSAEFGPLATETRRLPRRAAVTPSPPLSPPVTLTPAPPVTPIVAPERWSVSFNVTPAADGQLDDETPVPVAVGLTRSRPEGEARFALELAVAGESGALVEPVRSAVIFPAGQSRFDAELSFRTPDIDERAEITVVLRLLGQDGRELAAADPKSFTVVDREFIAYRNVKQAKEPGLKKNAAITYLGTYRQGRHRSEVSAALEEILLADAGRACDAGPFNDYRYRLGELSAERSPAMHKLAEAYKAYVAAQEKNTYRAYAGFVSKYEEVDPKSPCVALVELRIDPAWWQEKGEDPHALTQLVPRPTVS